MIYTKERKRERRGGETHNIKTDKQREKGRETVLKKRE